MKEIKVSEITKVIRELCIETNYYIDKDIYQALEEYKKKEISPIGKEILSQLQRNGEIAEANQMPICQDTGMVVVFCEMGQEVYLYGGNLEEAIQEGVREGYSEGYLRKSVVEDPFQRSNTGDNTPAVIHYEIVPGDKIKVTVAPKGFGSENMSRIYMLKPADGIEGAKQAILKTVDEAGGNACPPMIIGIGIGGTFEKAALLAKKALLRPLGSFSPKEHIADMEKELLEKINKLGIGPQGLGGLTTALGVHIETYPTHIAGLPVAINISCHVTRHGSREIG